jgi:hypothetical protein
MREQTDSLDDRMSEVLPDGGVAISGGRELYMEVMEPESRVVWMSAAAVKLADYVALELEAPLVKSGIGRAAMDRAAFRHSPGTPDEPVRERSIGRHRFIHVATPGEPLLPKEPGGPMEILVEKAHQLGFDTGRSVSILSLPEGDFVEVVGDADEDDARVLPAGGILKRIKLDEPWVVLLPTPTRTFFWWGEALRSFQGPVTLPTDGLAR